VYISKRDFEIIAGWGGYSSHTTNSDDRLRGSDRRWPVPNSLVSLWKGLVTLSRESESELASEGG
jgi:hypothetical protein